MDEKQKAELIAQAENVEAIAEFFSNWWSLDQLWETSAKATTLILDIMHRHGLAHDDAKVLVEMMEQHMMLIDLVKPFAKHDEQ